MRIAISNSGPLIHLSQIDGLNLLFSLFDIIYISETVFKEVIGDGLEYSYPDALLLENEMKQERIVVKEVQIGKIPSINTNNLHEGEIETIQLAMSLPGKPIILDDEEARIYARKMKLKVIGSLGIVIKCVKMGYLSKKDGVANIKSLNDIMYLSSDVFSLAIDRIMEN